MELTTEPDGVLKGYSPALGRSLCRRDGTPELYDPETGIYHIDLDQALDEVSAERIARQETEDERIAERMARQDAEAKIRQLEEELEQRRTDS